MNDPSPTPRVSVLLPCYNAERHLGRCLDSLLAQTYDDFEIVAIDDGSEDGTHSVLAEYSARDSRLRLRRSVNNVGLIRTLNRAIKQSKGEYVARMDADDEAVPDRLRTQVGFLDAHVDVDLVSSSTTLIDVAGRVVGERRAWATQPSACRYLATFATPVAHSAVMARRECFSGFGYSLEPEALHTEDYELWCRLLRAGKRIANCPEALLRYRVSPQRVSVRYEGVQVQNFVTCAQRHLREEIRQEPPREIVEILANRIDFQRPSVALDDGLRLLKVLTERALSRTANQIERDEIEGAAAMQRLDILLQCVLKGRLTLRALALTRLLTDALSAIRQPGLRHYLRQKMRAARLMGFR